MPDQARPQVRGNDFLVLTRGQSRYRETLPESPLAMATDDDWLSQDPSSKRVGLTLAAATAAVLATIVGIGPGCAEPRLAPPAPSTQQSTSAHADQLEQLRSQNAELTRRLAALERQLADTAATPPPTQAPVVLLEQPQATSDVSALQAQIETLRAQNTILFEKLEALNKKATPPPVVIPTKPSAPSAPAYTPRNHYSHSSHVSHSSHRSHRSHRSST